MTDLAKPKLSEEERSARAREKARLRKQRYDARMKGTDRDGATGGRKGCVLHLSEEAREVLRRNRLSRRLLDQDPVLDSELVESLLLAHRQQEQLLLPNVTLEVGNEKETLRLDKLVDRYAKLNEKLNDERHRLNGMKFLLAEVAAEAEDADRHRDMDWWEIEDVLLSQHQREMSLQGLRLLTTVRQLLSQSKSDFEACRNLAYELSDYICQLIDRR